MDPKLKKLFEAEFMRIHDNCRGLQTSASGMYTDRIVHKAFLWFCRGHEIGSKP